MMLAWSFAARTAAEVSALVRALGRHRYLREADYFVHFTLDLALAEEPAFAPAAAEWAARLGSGELDPDSRDPRLLRRASLDEIAAAFAIFWSAGPGRARACERLRAAHLTYGIALPGHAPFQSDPEDPPHPEMIILDWELYPIDELDPERHAGAMNALETLSEGEEVDVSAAVYQEAACIAAPELLEGAPNGVLCEDFVVWSDGAYAYADYVFRGAAKIAKLGEAPVGPRDGA